MDEHSFDRHPGKDGWDQNDYAPPREDSPPEELSSVEPYAHDANCPDAVSNLSIGTVIRIDSDGCKVMLDNQAIQKMQETLDDDHDSLCAIGRVGSYIKIRVEANWVVASIRNLSICETDDRQFIVDVDFLGEAQIDDNGRIAGFSRGIGSYPTTGDHVYAILSSDMTAIYSPKGRAHIDIGTVFPTRNVRGSVMIDPLLSKHFAVLGSTGCGKSTTVAMLLHNIIDADSHGHVILLDLHGEYVGSFESKAETFNVSNLEIPYWLMNLNEHVEVLIGDPKGRDAEVDILNKTLLAARSKSRLAADLGKITSDSPIPYMLSDFLGILQTQMGKLNQPDKTIPYIRLKNKMEELKNDPRYGFMFSGMLVSDTLEKFIGKILRIPNEGKPMSVIDLSGLPSDIINVVICMIARIALDFSVWTRELEQRPILLVCEEAHRYFPSDNVGSDSNMKHVLERIAKEGRKYGISLGIISQRPSDMSDTILSQCGTFITMRLNNQQDKSIVLNAMPEGSRSHFNCISSLANQECVICGEGVPLPMRVVIDTLEDEKCPNSNDPVFSRLWKTDVQTVDLVKQGTRLWRLQGK